MRLLTRVGGVVWDCGLAECAGGGVSVQSNPRLETLAFAQAVQHIGSYLVVYGKPVPAIAPPPLFYNRQQEWWRTFMLRVFEGV